MSQTFHMTITDVFFFRDGRTVLCGPIEEGEIAIVEPGPATILVGGKPLSQITIEREGIASRSSPMERLEVRAVPTRDGTGLDKTMVENQRCTLEGPMRYAGHRDLVGIDSPPDNYIPDNMTLGPRLPEGWDGDAWVKPGGDGCFLRAWSKAFGRYATAQGSKYEETRIQLLATIEAGGNRAEITVRELPPSAPQS